MYKHNKATFPLNSYNMFWERCQLIFVLNLQEGGGTTAAQSKTFWMCKSTFPYNVFNTFSMFCERCQLIFVLILYGRNNRCSMQNMLNSRTCIYGNVLLVDFCFDFVWWKQPLFTHKFNLYNGNNRGAIL